MIIVTLQHYSLLDYQKKYLAEQLNVYDLLIEKNLVKNQYHDLDLFWLLLTWL